MCSGSTGIFVLDTWEMVEDVPCVWTLSSVYNPHPLFSQHQAHLEQAGLLGEGEEVPANLWSSPVEASMLGMPSMSAGGFEILIENVFGWCESGFEVLGK